MDTLTNAFWTLSIWTSYSCCNRFVQINKHVLFKWTKKYTFHMDMISSFNNPMRRSLHSIQPQYFLCFEMFYCWVLIIIRFIILRYCAFCLTWKVIRFIYFWVPKIKNANKGCQQICIINIASLPQMPPFVDCSSWLTRE